jgi:hypothetical protein
LTAPQVEINKNNTFLNFIQCSGNSLPSNPFHMPTYVICPMLGYFCAPGWFLNQNKENTNKINMGTIQRFREK